jgi:YgiT-type zinc finger domain-containing protein
MGQADRKEKVTMLKCEICGGREFRQEEADEVFHIGERYVLVEHIPATVCVQCGEKTFDAATAEDIRKMLNEGRHAGRTVEMDVFAY